MVLYIMSCLDPTSTISKPPFTLTIGFLFSFVEAPVYSRFTVISSLRLHALFLPRGVNPAERGPTAIEGNTQNMNRKYGLTYGYLAWNQEALRRNCYFVLHPHNNGVLLALRSAELYARLTGQDPRQADLARLFLSLLSSSSCRVLVLQGLALAPWVIF